MSGLEQLEQHDDKLQVERWRLHRLLAMGLPHETALTTALSPIDLHELERLIANGCPPALAVEILL